LLGLSIDQFNSRKFLKALEFAQRFTEAAKVSADPSEQGAGPGRVPDHSFLFGDFDAAERYCDVLFEHTESATGCGFGGFGLAASRA
jgi:hypothetical protein